MDFGGFLTSGAKPIILGSTWVAGGLGATGSVPIPKSAKFVFVTAIGSGGNGGAGFIRTAGSAGGGGGGGGSGGMGQAIIPASAFPGGVLFYKVDQGGGVGVTGIYPTYESSKASNWAFLSVSSGSNGGTGTGAAAGAAGGAAAAGQVKWPAIGSSIIGNAGIIGGVQTGAVGGTSTTSNIPVTMGGAGGAGCTTTDFAGGPCTYATLLTYTLAGGLAGGGKGNDGWVLPQYLSSFGGSGGGSFNSGAGGAGGRGGPGCGGGGGGAGQTAGSGLGGSGGDGEIRVWFV